MTHYSKDELNKALHEVSSTIIKCEKMQLKFAEGTSHYSLLKNRIKAMCISKFLLEKELLSELMPKSILDCFTQEELSEALRPIDSIISKCAKGQTKFAEGTSHHTRFKNIIEAMVISKALITAELLKIK